MTNKQLIWFYTIAILFWVIGISLISKLSVYGTIQLDLKDYFLFTQVVYVLVICLLTRWLVKNKYFKINLITTLGLLLGLYMAFIGTRFFIEEFLSPYIIGRSNYFKETFILYYIMDNIYYGSINIAFAFMLALFDNQVRLQKEQYELQQSYQSAQLAYLRAQISPHFLFNALNSIYALAYKKSDDTPQAVLELSELLRYVLQHNDKENTVQKEWDVILGYINLQKLRSAKPQYLSLEPKGDFLIFIFRRIY